MADWSKGKAQALKILGDGAEVPELPDPVMKASTAFQKANGEFKTSREECEGKLLALDDANAAMINSIEQFRAKIEKNDFKLDPKKDIKKLQQARVILTGELDRSLKELKDNDKVLAELNKHLMQLGKYKQSSGPF